MCFYGLIRNILSSIFDKQSELTKIKVIYHLINFAMSSEIYDGKTEGS